MTQPALTDADIAENIEFLERIALEGITGFITNPEVLQMAKDLRQARAELANRDGIIAVHEQTLATQKRTIVEVVVEWDRLQTDLDNWKILTGQARSEREELRLELHTLRELAGRLCDALGPSTLSESIKSEQRLSAAEALRAHLGEAAKPKEDGND